MAARIVPDFTHVAWTSPDSKGQGMIPLLGQHLTI